MDPSLKLSIYKQQLKKDCLHTIVPQAKKQVIII